jgi:hypothetical protein
MATAVKISFAATRHFPSSVDLDRVDQPVTLKRTGSYCKLKCTFLNILVHIWNEERHDTFLAIIDETETGDWFHQTLLHTFTIPSYTHTCSSVEGSVFTNLCSLAASNDEHSPSPANTTALLLYTILNQFSTHPKFIISVCPALNTSWLAVTEMQHTLIIHLSFLQI